MRHELTLGEWVVTSDNSAAIGEKPLDAVQASDEMTAKFAARVALLEQWAAGSEPAAVLLHNFSGETQWARYVAGIEELFSEIGLTSIQLAGSSETNMETMQSGVAVTMMGKRIRDRVAEPLEWFVYGMPLAGQEVIEKKEQIADLKKIQQAQESGLIERVWPVGSKGIAIEAERLLGKTIEALPAIDVFVSGGPSTCVLIGGREEKIDEMKNHFGEFFIPLR
ncbi:alpha-ribazole-5-phosphate synthase [Planococcus sp. YIM B11945]|uniref:alpha-ribazole-5-phosphate synthase n=1 Tax=Planococcus sp. YIM B11945 TaxID=3435410 RepID=UPI003D7C5F5C